MKPFFDRILKKTMSKKLTVFFIGTVFLFLGKLEAAQWVNVAMVYIGSQAGVDAIIALRKKHAQNNDENLEA